MIIILSPAKKLDLKIDEKVRDNTTPLFLDKSSQLIEELRQFSPTDLAVLMNVSDDIANLTFERYSKWKAPFDTDNAGQALLSFNGDVYRSMKPENFSADDIDFAQDHLRILSGLYGMLKPLDLIQPYRLEMGAKYITSGGKSLYRFWIDTITEAINSDLEKHREKVLVNLASQEYFRVVDTEKLRGRVVTPVFKEYRDDKYKVIGILAKKARGMMSRFIIQNRLKKAEDIKHFSMEGYSYDDNLSSGNELVFTR